MMEERLQGLLGQLVHVRWRAGYWNGDVQGTLRRGYDVEGYWVEPTGMSQFPYVDFTEDMVVSVRDTVITLDVMRLPHAH